MLSRGPSRSTRTRDPQEAARGPLEARSAPRADLLFALLRGVRQPRDRPDARNVRDVCRGRAPQDQEEAAKGDPSAAVRRPDMRRKEKDPGAVLDRIANEIRQETIDPAVEQQAAARVWSLLSAKIPAAAAAAESLSPDGRIEGCSGFQELFASYLQGGLSQARCLLLEDHLQACVRCRKALRSRSATGAGGAVERSPGDWGVAGVETASRVEERRGPRRGLAGAERAGDEADGWKLFVPGRAARWGLAAAALVGVSLAGLAAIRSLSPTAPVELAHVESIEGGLFRLSEGGSPVATSERLRPGEAVRTGKGSGALVRLDDGSLVEMKERSEISVTGGGGGATGRGVGGGG